LFVALPSYSSSFNNSHYCTTQQDEASFGCFLAEFELMCHNHTEVEEALARIDLVCDDLGVVGALNQDRASKFVRFILLDPQLLARTQMYAPDVLLTGEENLM
jgi:hypothetical protein